MKRLLASLTLSPVLIFLAPSLAHATATTWNSADKSSSMTLSSGNLTATQSGSGWHAVRNTAGKSSGKWYWEITITNLPIPGEISNGILKSTTTLDPVGNFNGVGTGNIFTYDRHGEKANGDGTNPSYGTAYVTGNIVAFAVDFDTGKIWAANNSTGSLVWQASGDPVAETNEMYSGISGTYMPSFEAGIDAGSVTANFGAAAFTYTPPTGYSAWDTTAATSTVNRLAKFTTTTQTLGDSLFSDDGSNTTLTAGNLFMQIGSLIDTITGGALNFGTTNATSINVGKVGVTTTFSGLLAVNGLATFGNNITVPAAYGIDTATAGALNIGTSTATSITIGKAGATTTFPGVIAWGKAATTANCNSSASPAVCGSAPAGSVAMATGVSTLVVNTTAVTADSQIFVIQDSSLDTRLGITCNTTASRVYSINARTAGTSFTIKSSANPTTNKACLSYWIIN
jgi:hypothetical protein